MTMSNTNIYGKPYCFQQQDGCKDRGVCNITVPTDEPYDYENDNLPDDVGTEEMGVSFKGWLSRDPDEKLSNREYDFQLDMWWSRNFYPTIEMIANDLHSRGLMDAGKYTIIIDW